MDASGKRVHAPGTDLSGNKSELHKKHIFQQDRMPEPTGRDVRRYWDQKRRFARSDSNRIRHTATVACPAVGGVLLLPVEAIQLETSRQPGVCKEIKQKQKRKEKTSETLTGKEWVV